MKRPALVEAMLAEVRAAEGDQLAALRALADEAEAELIRAALAARGWVTTAAAADVGARSSTMQMALRRRHPELDAERRAKGRPYVRRDP